MRACELPDLTLCCVACSSQFMNNDYVGRQKGRCGNMGYDKNELKFSAYVKSPNPFAPQESSPSPVVHLA